MSQASSSPTPEVCVHAVNSSSYFSSLNSLNSQSTSTHSPIHIPAPIVLLRANPSEGETMLIHDIPFVILKWDLLRLYNLYQIPRGLFEIFSRSLEARANGATNHRTLMVYEA